MHDMQMYSIQQECSGQTCELDKTNYFLLQGSCRPTIIFLFTAWPVILNGIRCILERVNFQCQALGVQTVGTNSVLSMVVSDHGIPLQETMK